MSGGHVLALCGGVGGAKLAAGLAAVLSPGRLSVVVNTGDDFEHLGLAVSPDIDTVVYTLAGLADEARGWGLADEGWRALTMLGRLQGPQWFRLGDADLAMHITRTRWLREGESLSQITASLAAALGIGAAVMPMTDDAVATEIVAQDGRILPFQKYFVAEQCRPAVRAVRYAGAEYGRPSPGFAAALARADLAAVIICPSNPYLSIEPLLALPDVREHLATLDVPRIAVSPIIAGTAIKGPLAKMMTELGVTPGVASIARHYRGLIDSLVIDEADRALAAQVEAQGITPVIALTLMHCAADRTALARAVLKSCGIAPDT